MKFEVEMQKAIEILRKNNLLKVSKIKIKDCEKSLIKLLCKASYLKNFKFK